MRSENARDWPDAIENAPNESPLRHQPAVARSVLPCCSTGREQYYSAREHKTKEHAAQPCHTLTAPIALCGGTSRGVCRSSSAAKRRTLHSVQTRRDPPKFRRRVFLSERRTGEQVLAHGRASHEDRLESNIADELFSGGDGLLVVAGDRHTDEAALPVGERPETRREVLQVLGMARREHHGVPRLHEQLAEGTAHASGPDHADLERRRGRCLGARPRRSGGERECAKPAPGQLEKIAAAMISGFTL